MIEFEVYSEDSEVHTLVARYWRRDDNGKFVENVSALLPFREIGSSSLLIKYINRISSARNSEYLCSTCKEPCHIHSRADLSSRKRYVKHTCQYCNILAAEEQRRSDEAKATELRRLIKEADQRARELVLDYREVKDDIALILLALDKAINPRLTTGYFTAGDFNALAPYENKELLLRLWNSSVIAAQPKLASDGAYFLEGGRLRFYLDKAVFSLAPDKRRERSLATLENRKFFDSIALFDLWLSYAANECLAYFVAQCDIHNLRLNDDAICKVKSITRSALERYSTAQLWFGLWKVVRDAAALSTREYYNSRKAAATLPGKLKCYLEDVDKGNANLKEWNRQSSQPAGTLGDEFFNRFGINENTAGTLVKEIFSKLDAETLHDSCEKDARDFMHKSITYGIELSVLESFADMIRSGDDVATALAMILDGLQDI